MDGEGFTALQTNPVHQHAQTHEQVMVIHDGYTSVRISALTLKGQVFVLRLTVLRAVPCMIHNVTSPIVTHTYMHITVL